MNPFSAGRRQQGLPQTIRQFGEYVVITEWEDAEELAEHVRGCIVELMEQKERMKEEMELIELQGSMEIVVKAWPDTEKPVGYSVAMGFMAKRPLKRARKQKSGEEKTDD